nr:amidohydrolase family protein [Clostridia bacterium]
MEIYHGNIVFSKSRNELAEYKNSYIVVENGIVDGIYESLPEKYANMRIEDFGKDVIIPAFSDLHVHAPQYPNRGLAMDELLSNWLNKYTFPLEAKYEDEQFAKEVYSSFVDDMINHGTMHSIIFGTIHNKATDILIELLENKGLLSYVGKVNMDQNSPSYLCEETNESIRKTEAFIQSHINNKYSKPILTPRFAPTCSFDLLKKLGKLASKYEVGVQTHVVESIWEAEEAKKCFNGCRCDMQIYKEAGLLDNGPVIAAHFIFPSQEDKDILKAYNGYAVQCPDATTNVIAGIMKTGVLLDNDVNIGLGSDISAGQSLGIYKQIAS